MGHRINKVVEVYRKIIKFPEPASARISRLSSNSKTIVHTEWSQHDLEKSEVVKYNRDYCLSKADDKFIVDFTSPNTEVTSELWNVESPSGKYRAVVKKTKKKEEDKYYIEIWDRTHKHLNIDTSSVDKHGKIYEKDDQFGNLAWSYSEKCLVYIAEKKQPKVVSYFDTKKSDDTKKEEEITRGTEHFYKEDWGEQLTGKHQSVICVLDLDTKDIKVLDSIPDDLFPGQPCWAPGDTGVVFAGWKINPYRLGIIYCPIRDSSLYYLDFNTSEIIQISESGRSIRCPRVSPDQTKLVYLDSDVGGPHMQGSRLMMCDWSSKEVSVIVDTVKESKEGEFPGLYLISLPVNCWSSDSNRIVFSSVWRSQVVCLSIDTTTKSVSRISKDAGCSTVLDVYNDQVIVSCSAPNMPPHLCVGELPSTGSLELTPIDGEPVTLSGIKYEIMTFEPTDDRAHPKYGKIQYEGFLVMPKEEQGETKPPLIVFPHGGPHSVFTTTFMPFIAGFVECGFAVLAVNYRGSFGFGENSLRSLPGYVGDMDVKDCQAAAEKVVQSGRVDTTRVAVFGGSHGGFLTTHLIGQYPEFYKAASCRNPVVNFTNTVGITDIPDLIYVEAGHVFDFKSIPDDKMLAVLWKVSSIRHVDNVKTPLQIMLGLDDRRVPPKQGEQYYKALKARNVPARLLRYEGNCHPISKPDAQADSFVNTVSWFDTHMKIE